MNHTPENALDSDGILSRRYYVNIAVRKKKLNYKTNYIC